jgi:hypothetical protein
MADLLLSSMSFYFHIASTPASRLASVFSIADISILYARLLQ